MSMNMEKINNINWFSRDPMDRQGCFYGTIVACVLFILMFAFSSCGTKTLIEYRDVNHYITKEVHDTLKEKTTDSVYFEVVTKGDTVFATKYKESIRWRDRVVERHDTCYRDSVVTKNETVEIVKYPKTYKYAVAISLIFFIFVAYKFARWLKF